MSSPEAFVREPARDIPLLDQVDVLVAGGGPAGIAAAAAAAREGARVALVERYGYLGGMVTGADVVAIIGAGDGKEEKVRGFTRELRERLGKLGAVRPLKCGDYRVDNETFKWQAAELLLEAGVILYLHTLVCAPMVEGHSVTGAFVESKSGRQAIQARVTVDATADADLAHRAGCGSENETHDATLVTRIRGVDRERVAQFRAEHPEEYERITHHARERNGGVLPGQGRKLKGVDLTDAISLTQAEIRLRRELFQALLYLREHLPGYENAQVAHTFPQFGGRLSRRIHGEYTLLDADLRSNRRFEDNIGSMGVYFPDWGPNYAIEGLEYDVPYRNLVPRDRDKLLVAGRCVSADARAGNTLRLIVPCFVTGQGAGCAAAIAARQDTSPRHVAISQLQGALRRQDVYL